MFLISLKIKTDSSERRMCSSRSSSFGWLALQGRTTWPIRPTRNAEENKETTVCCAPFGKVRFLILSNGGKYDFALVDLLHVPLRMHTALQHLGLAPGSPGQLYRVLARSLTPTHNPRWRFFYRQETTHKLDSGREIALFEYVVNCNGIRDTLVLQLRSLSFRKNHC